MDENDFQKPFGGKIRYWCRHIFTAQVPADILKEKMAENPDYSAEIFTGEVVNDALGRWRPGDSMRSSPIVSFDEKTLLVETENTVYQLVGPGRVSRTPPLMYWIEVGKTIKLLSNDPEGAASDEDDSILVYPKKPEEDKKE